MVLSPVLFSCMLDSLPGQKKKAFDPQYAIELSDKGLQNLAVLKGIELVDEFSLIPSFVHCLQFKAKSLADWIPDGSYDWITCVHGLHYVGDKIKILTKMFSTIAAEGMLIANLDL